MENLTISAPAASADNTLESMTAAAGITMSKPDNGKQFLLDVPVPTATKTYQPLSHADLIGAVMEQLDKKGLIVKDERYTWNRSGQQMFGQVVIAGSNGEQDMSLGFRNSYVRWPEQGLSVILLSNRNDPTPYPTAVQIGELILRERGVADP